MLMFRGRSPDIVRPRLGETTGVRTDDVCRDRTLAAAVGRDAVGDRVT